MKTYISVKASRELPEKDGRYHVDLGYGPETRGFNPGRSDSMWIRRGAIWLKEIESVSKDELYEVFANHADHTPYLNFDAFSDAINEFLTNKL